MSDTAPTVVRLEFDKVRKLKARHRNLRDAVRTSGKSITELLTDPFGGYPYLVQALLVPSADRNESITLDKASDFIDLFIEKHKSIEPLTRGLIEALSAYLHVEMTPTEDEKDADGNLPNAGTPGRPGLASD